MTLAIDTATPAIHIRPLQPRSSTTGLASRSSPASQFSKNCAEKFHEMAKQDLSGLVGLIYGELASDRVMLSFALEALHLVGEPQKVVGILSTFLQHPEAIVREGAILGLQPYLDSSRMARDLLKSMRDADKSEGVRRAAADALLILDP